MFSLLKWQKLGKLPKLSLRNPLERRFSARSKRPQLPSLITDAGARSNWPLALHLWTGATDANAADATIRALTRGMQWERAAAFLGQQNVSVSGHGVALRTSAEATSWKHCLAILSTMQLRRVDITPTSLNAAIVSCGRRFMWQTALGLLFTHVDDLNASKSHRYDTGRSTECAMAVLTALQVAHQWEQAVALFTTWPLPESQVSRQNVAD